MPTRSPFEYSGQTDVLAISLSGDHQETCQVIIKSTTCNNQSLPLLLIPAIDTKSFNHLYAILAFISQTRPSSTRFAMHFTAITILSLAAAAFAAPGDRGHYTVSGLGARKQAILNAGGNTLDIAIAMLEDEHMQTNYKYGE